MNLAHLIIVGCLFAAVQGDVVINQITGITGSNLMFTGTIDVPNSAKLFFTFYGIKGETDMAKLSDSPLVVAVGSPGRSAHYANLGGLGPKILNNDMSLSDNPNAITDNANFMVLDSLGSGFSFVTSGNDLPDNAKGYGAILTAALNAFIGSDLGKSQKMYLIGESTFLRSTPGLDDIDPLAGIFHISSWFDLYELGKYYGVAGLDLKIFTDVERITIETTFTNCYNQQRSGKFQEAHSCYDVTLNYVESKTKNINLMNVNLQSNLTNFLPMIQYYLSQSSVVSAYKAPTQALFDSQSPWVQTKIYNDLAKNIDSDISQFLKDYLSVKNIFISGDYDFICYRKASRNWLENSINFVESAKFKPLNLTELNVDGKLAGYYKSVNQVAYYEILNAGHFSYNEQPAVIKSIINSYLVQKDQNIVIQEGNTVPKHIRNPHLESS